jgi:hypothetical protein
MTGLTYRNREEERDDRQQQERLLVALDAASSQLRRDEAGWWTIGGRHGVINTWGDGRTWLAYVVCRSARQWTITKRRLQFMTVTQDGDDEGCLRLFELPTAAQARVLRDVLGLKKQRQYDPETLDQLRTTARGLVRARRVAEAPPLAPELPDNGIAPDTRRTTPPAVEKKHADGDRT